MILSFDNIWYAITFFCTEKKIQCLDSLKKFPGCSVNAVAKLYGIEGKKEYPDFDRYRPESYIPSEEEVEYCLQDSRIMAVAMTNEIRNGHDGMTLSSDAFKDVKSTIGGYKGWRVHMPILETKDEQTARMSYKGGWVYVNPVYQGEELHDVHVYDVNSLYPWVMHECRLPDGPPMHRRPMGHEVGIVQFLANFKLDWGFPMIQQRFIHTYKHLYIEHTTQPMSMCMTSVDLALFMELYDYEILSEPIWMSFKTRVGLLAPYIDKWMKVKEEAVMRGDMAMKYMAKRWLNSPYGKTGMNPLRRNKHPIYNDGVMDWHIVNETTDPVYVPYASFVCAWARDKTMRACLENEDVFVYADTDSMHLLCEADNVEVHPTKLGAWKHESYSERAKYLRAKTYIHESQGKIEVTCAGMPDTVKEQVTWDNFKVGSVFQGKKMKKNVRGGCMIVDRTFEIKEE